MAMASSMIRIKRIDYEKLLTNPGISHTLSTGKTAQFDPNAIYLIEDENPRIDTELISNPEESNLKYNLIKVDGQSAAVAYARNGLKEANLQYSKFADFIKTKYNKIVTIIWYRNDYDQTSYAQLLYDYDYISGTFHLYKPNSISVFTPDNTDNLCIYYY